MPALNCHDFLGLSNCSTQEHSGNPVHHCCCSVLSFFLYLLVLRLLKFPSLTKTLMTKKCKRKNANLSTPNFVFSLAHFNPTVKQPWINARFTFLSVLAWSELHTLHANWCMKMVNFRCYITLFFCMLTHEGSLHFRIFEIRDIIILK